EEVALVQAPGDGAGTRLDVDPRVAVVRVARVEPGEGRDDAVLAAPGVVPVVKARVSDRPPEAVWPGHVAHLALADDAGEDRAVRVEENRAPPVEQRRRLDVLAPQVGVVESELREQPVPGLGRDLLQAQVFSFAR